MTRDMRFRVAGCLGGGVEIDIGDAENALDAGRIADGDLDVVFRAEKRSQDKGPGLR